MILIWLVQVIIYPGFHRIPDNDFIDYHRWYASRISIIVVPFMISEMMMTTWWLWRGPMPESIFSAGLVLTAWFSTFFIQVPIHKRLSSGKDERLIRRLVATNWIRTAAWSLKAFIITLAVNDRLL
jgi:hypothetical protein